MADNPRIEELRRRVQKDPASIAFAQLAEEYRRSGDYEEAARICRTGLSRHPSYLSARVTLGRALIELQQYDDAQAELDYVLQSAPENLAAIRGLAEIHQRRGNLAEALRQYRTALAIAKHDPELEESVHDLTRQLGGPAPVRAETQPPPIPFDLPDTTFDAFGEPTGAPSAASPLSLSPELEAAADEFTKALAALDALALDLPVPALPASDLAPADVVHAEPPPAESAQLDAVELGTVELQTVELEAAPPEPAPAPLVEATMEPAAEPSADDIAVNQLESWLDAIELDRNTRNAHRS